MHLRDHYEKSYIEKANQNMNEAVAHLNDAFFQLDKAISQFEKEGNFEKVIAARGAQNILRAAITYILQALSTD